MAKEYIEREMLIKKIQDKYKPLIDVGSLAQLLCQSIEETIAEQPAADVVEAKHSEWIKMYPQDRRDGSYFCASCHFDLDIATGEETPIDRGMYFCLNCGAKMDGGQV